MSSGSASESRVRSWYENPAYNPYERPWDVHRGIDYGLLLNASREGLERAVNEPIANNETRAFIRTQLALRILAEGIEEPS